MNLNLNNLSTIVDKTKGIASRGGLILSKNSPQIWMWAGILGGVATTVLACIATAKYVKTIDDTQEDLEKIKEKKETFANDVYTNEDYKKDLVGVYSNAAISFIRSYGPAIILGIASGGAVLKGNSILNKRNLGLMAAFKVVDESYKNYRDRVAREFGEEKEREIRYPGKSERRVVGQDPEGKDVVEKVPVNEKKDDQFIDGQVREHEWGRWFDDRNPRWLQDISANHYFLMMQQNYWNIQLQSHGHVFLNDIYRSLGFKDTADGQMVGWFKKPGQPCFIDFGLREQSYYFGQIHIDSDNNENAEGFWLDFNVQGVILDMLRSK